MINYGWVCPKCGRVFAPNQEMCLYCGGENKITAPPISEWISTNPCEINTTKGPTNIKETNGAKGSPYYTTTTGAICLDTAAPNVVLKECKENINASAM